MNSNINNGINTGTTTGMGQSTPFGGMEERHQDPGGPAVGVRGMASKAGEKIMDTAERQKAMGADYVDDIAGAVRRAADEFDDQIPQAAQYIRYAADQMETMSDSLRRRDISQMMQDVQSFARRQPTAFLGLSFVAGFAAIRFLRSGSSGSSTDGDRWQGREGTRDEERFGESRSGRMPGAGL